MMRRLTSAPKPAARVEPITRSMVRGPSSGSTRWPKRTPSYLARFEETSEDMMR